jgi:hypothetical protein
LNFVIDFYFLKFIFQESIEADKHFIASRLNDDSILGRKFNPQIACRSHIRPWQ